MIFFKKLYPFSFLIIIYCFTFAFTKNVSSADMTKQKPIEKIVYLKGTLGKLHYFQPNVIEFKTGNLYKLKLVNQSNSKHYFSSSKFSKSIFTRKVQIKIKNDMVAEIKGHINEVEIFPNFELEWWFVPIKTGEFSDLGCSVVDKKTKKKHSDMGMVGTIKIY